MAWPEGPPAGERLKNAAAAVPHRPPRAARPTSLLPLPLFPSRSTPPGNHPRPRGGDVPQALGRPLNRQRPCGTGGTAGGQPRSPAVEHHGKRGGAPPRGYRPPGCGQAATCAQSRLRPMCPTRACGAHTAAENRRNKNLAPPTRIDSAGGPAGYAGYSTHRGRAPPKKEGQPPPRGGRGHIASAIARRYKRGARRPPTAAPRPPPERRRGTKRPRFGGMTARRRHEEGRAPGCTVDVRFDQADECHGTVNRTTLVHFGGCTGIMSCKSPQSAGV